MRATIVSPHPVHPANSGDRVRTAQLLAGLAALGVDVSLVAWTWGDETGDPVWASRFRRGKPPKSIRWLVWRLRLNARRRTDALAVYSMAHESASLVPLIHDLEPDVVDFQHSYTWTPTGIPDVCTFHNVETQLAESFSGSRPEAVEAVRRREKAALESVEAAVAFSRDDARRARAIAPAGAPIVEVPLGYRPSGAERKRIHQPKIKTAIFVGTLSYRPNEQAARMLVEMWPRLRAESGLERLVILGRDASSYVRSGDGIVVVSDATTVAPYLVDADVTLVPLTAGGGVRVKIIEAFALGVPVISTRIGIEGLRAEDNVHAVVIDAVDQLPEALGRVADSAARSRLADNAYDLWQSTYSPERMAESMLDVYADVIRRAARETPALGELG